MMKYTVYAPLRIGGTAQLPASKSISNRALILHALSGSEDGVVYNRSDCDDTFVLERALRGESSVVDIGAAGTAMRFLTAYFSVTPGTRDITGTERMRQRPISVLVDALRSLGAEITYLENEGYPPLRITGRVLKGGHLELPGNVSSQYISALLMIGPLLSEGLTITLKGEVISRPYIDLTLKLMGDFGVKAEWQTDFSLRVPHAPYVAVNYEVEGDWSAASYWYQIVALANEADELFLPGLREASFQGDSKVAFLFGKLGVHTEYKQGGVCLTQKGNPVERLDYDFIDQPDLAQTFVVTCALLAIPFRFTGLQTLKIKETDRIAALRAEMRKLGYLIGEEDDSVLYWKGENVEPTLKTPVQTYKDHRMAMAFAPASLVLPFVKIDDPGVVSKSYPTFWNELCKMGFRIEESAS